MPQRGRTLRPDTFYFSVFSFLCLISVGKESVRLWGAGRTKETLFPLHFCTFARADPCSTNLTDPCFFCSSLTNPFFVLSLSLSLSSFAPFVPLVCYPTSPRYTNPPRICLRRLFPALESPRFWAISRIPASYSGMLTSRHCTMFTTGE